MIRTAQRKEILRKEKKNATNIEQKSCGANFKLYIKMEWKWDDYVTGRIVSDGNFRRTLTILKTWETGGFLLPCYSRLYLSSSSKRYLSIFEITPLVHNLVLFPVWYSTSFLKVSIKQTIFYNALLICNLPIRPYWLHIVLNTEVKSVAFNVKYFSPRNCLLFSRSFPISASIFAFALHSRLSRFLHDICNSWYAQRMVSNSHSTYEMEKNNLLCWAYPLQITDNSHCDFVTKAQVKSRDISDNYYKGPRRGRGQALHVLWGKRIK